ncbi:hypothetical protein [Bacillus sp. Hm123]|uniref:hypothetical protein n=1 Tax=Bacillus sp. Hm123 TaxID=3450745 RepID=UPI003F41B90E
MTKKHEKFCCPTHIPVREQIDDFCIPEECCPDRFPSPQFPSPSSCLPKKLQAQVTDDIRKTNQFLLDLALSDHRPPHEIFQQAFEGLIDIQVEVTTQSGERIKGEVAIVGFDFVSLCNGQTEFILPYEQVQFITSCDRLEEPDHEPELIDIELCCRRELTFHFGQIVSSSPQLLHIFFTIRLNIYLFTLEGRRIEIQTEGATNEGVMKEVDKDTIVLEVGEECKIIPINKVLLITMK